MDLSPPPSPADARAFHLPEPFLRWFAAKGWSPRPHQLDLLARAETGASVLLIAPTGAGKTLAGFLLLTWGDRVEVRALGASERLQRLVPQRGVRLEPTRVEALLDLASLPAFEVSRPRSWASLPEAGKRLLELAATPTAGA